MGKKSLTKSTTKKKSKKSTKKKTVETPVNNVHNDQNPSENLNTYENPLLHRRFDAWNPGKPWKPKPDKSYEKNFSAPPLVKAKGKEAKRIRSLLSMDVGLGSVSTAGQEIKAAKGKKAAPEKNAAAPAKPAEKGKKKAPAKPKQPPKKKPTRKELLGLGFPEWQPEKPYAPDTAGEYEKGFAAPPAFENVDSALIRRQFDLSAPVKTATAQQPAKASEPVETLPAETPPVETPEPAEQAAAPEQAAEKAPPVQADQVKPPVPVGELLKMRFEMWQPEKPYAPDTTGEYEKGFAAPPAFENVDPALIRRQFDLNAPVETATAQQPAEASEPVETLPAETPPGETPEPAEQAAAPEQAAEEAPPVQADQVKPSVPVGELLKMRFEMWQPEKPYAPDTTGEYEKGFAAPPAFENVDPALIRRQFDLSAPVETTAAQQPAEAPEPVKASEDVVRLEAPATTPEPETVQPEPAAENATQTKEPIETAETESTMEQITPTKTVEEAATDKPEPDSAAQAFAAEPETMTGGPGGGGFGGDGGDGGDGPGIPPREPKEPLLGTGTKILVASLALVFLILIGTSISNSNRYVLQETRQGVEIFRGDFSPRGIHKIALLPNAEMPEIEKPAYTREEAFDFAYNHFMSTATAMMEDDEVPIDMRGIRNNLEYAREYARTPDQRRVVDNNLKQLDFAMLVYRADVAAAKQTREGYTSALEFLDRAAALDIDSPGRIAMLEAKTEKIQNHLEALEEEPAETEVPEEDPVEEEPMEEEPVEEEPVNDDNVDHQG